jgi:hypothetical protein
VSSRSYNSITANPNADITPGHGFTGYGPNDAMNDGSDLSGAFHVEDNAEASYALQWSDYDGAIPANSTVSQVRIPVRVSRNGVTCTATPYRRTSGGTYAFGTTFSSFTAYPTFNPETITWTTDGAGAAWTKASAFASFFGFRADANGGSGDTFYWSEASFILDFTLPAPSATTGAANSVNQTGATLEGTINPNGATAFYPVSYRFDYGLTSSYGSSTTLTGGQTGSGDIIVNAALTGLTPNTTYHFRVVALNADGTTNGSDQTFLTLPGDAILFYI